MWINKKNKCFYYYQTLLIWIENYWNMKVRLQLHIIALIGCCRTKTKAVADICIQLHFLRIPKSSETKVLIIELVLASKGRIYRYEVRGLNYHLLPLSCVKIVKLIIIYRKWSKDSSSWWWSWLWTSWSCWQLWSCHQLWFQQQW